MSAYDNIAVIVGSASNFSMIDNIWHLRGATKLPSEVTDAIAIERLEVFLEKQCKPVSERGNSSIEFHAPLQENLSTSNWLALFIYDHGKFWIDAGFEGRFLRYNLRSLHGLVLCLLLALLFFVFASFFNGIEAGVRVSLQSFAWLYGGNIALAWARIPVAIRKFVRGS